MTECDPLLLEFMKSFIRSLTKYLLSPCYVPDNASGSGDPVGNRAKPPSYGVHTGLGGLMSTPVSPGIRVCGVIRPHGRIRKRVFYPEHSGFLRTSPLCCVKGGCGEEAVMGF